MILDKSNPEYKNLPGIGVLVGGLWVANIYYWGFNQYIIQRTLAAKSLKESQKGIKKAQKFLRQAAQKDQKNVRAFALLGEVLAMQGESRKAIGAFNFALQLSPKYYSAWLQRARVLLVMGLVNDVQKSYVVLARNEPDLANELLVAIDTWLTNREQPLSEADCALMEWRNTQG